MLERKLKFLFTTQLICCVVDFGQRGGWVRVLAKNWVSARTLAISRILRILNRTDGWIIIDVTVDTIELWCMIKPMGSCDLPHTFFVCFIRKSLDLLGRLCPRWLNSENMIRAAMMFSYAILRLIGDRVRLRRNVCSGKPFNEHWNGRIMNTDRYSTSATHFISICSHLNESVVK